MFKKVMLAVVPMLALGTFAVAEDDLLSGIDVNNITDAAVEIDDFDLDGLDVDQLASDAEGKDGDEAIEACFRRFGYSSYNSYGYGYSNYSNYGYSYPSYYSSYRTYNHNPYYCYRPVHYRTYHYTPVYNHYWGCY